MLFLFFFFIIVECLRFQERFVNFSLITFSLTKLKPTKINSINVCYSFFLFKIYALNIQASSKVENYQDFYSNCNWKLKLWVLMRINDADFQTIQV